MTKIVTEVKFPINTKITKIKVKIRKFLIKSKYDKIFKNKKYLKLVTINQKTKRQLFFNLTKVS